MDLSPPPGFDPRQLRPPPLHSGPKEPVSLALDVSGSCNLACRYCAEADTQPERRPMSLATLDRAWQVLLPKIEAGARTSIHFGSGEPLLALPLLHRLGELIDDAAAAGPIRRPDVFLTSNGTLMPAAVRDWLVSSGWRVKISLDGPSTVHNRWRIDPSGEATFGSVARTVRDLAARMPERLSVTAVLCRGAGPDEVFAAIADLGVRRIELVPVAHHDPAVCPSARDIEAYRHFVRDHAQRYLIDRGDGNHPSLIRFETSVLRAMGYRLGRASCAAGRTYLGVSPDGDLVPCFRFVGMKDYVLGSLEGGIDPARARAFQDGPGRGYDRRLDCRQCWAAPLCGGPCFANAEMFGPGDGRPIALHCAYARADAWAAADLVARLHERAPHRLLSFLPVTGALEGLQ